MVDIGIITSEGGANKQIVANVVLPKDSTEKLRDALSVVNLGISLEAKASMEQVAKAMLDAMRPYPEINFGGIQKVLEEFAKPAEALNPVKERMVELSRNLSDLIDAEILSAKKSAKKPAKKPANSEEKLTARHREILEVMEVGVEYTREDISKKVGLKSSRTRELINELISLGIIEKNGSTKGSKYKRL